MKAHPASIMPASVGRDASFGEVMTAGFDRLTIDDDKRSPASLPEVYHAALVAMTASAHGRQGSVSGAA